MLKRINDVLDWIYPINGLTFIGIIFMIIGPGGMGMSILLANYYPVIGELDIETEWRWAFGAIGIIGWTVALVAIIAIIRYPFLSREAKIALAKKNEKYNV